MLDLHYDLWSEQYHSIQMLMFATFIMFIGDFADTFDNELIAKLDDNDILGE